VGDDRRARDEASRGVVHRGAARRRRGRRRPQGTEEATEVLLAAKNDERAEAAGADRAELRGLLAGEAADLVYHALVLLAERGLPPREVIATLRARHGDPVGA
jgi:phosphoribosyl-ATP pyrophosphohydrolase